MARGSISFPDANNPKNVLDLNACPFKVS
ncbi:hypothetical protein MES5069_450057 [Mesorhizobium escarrei]|uniref:Uncharacterized protein n=1 Tax=Mesorhizobium escarrei TaxID=666018 RepID=A0ABM9E7H4_9HYPH|nr:hypothetical protein MES5069_450057 [Mesorhizobium escarrei]